MTTPHALADERAQLTADPARFGVGARITVAVMADDFVERITSILGELDTRDLAVDTTDVSTFFGGDEQTLLDVITDLLALVAAQDVHATVSLLLSRGCPGEARCELPGGAGPRSVELPEGRKVGIFASAEWALYPLADDGDHMRDIEQAIADARATDLDISSEHFVTRLAGDAGDIAATIVRAWTAVGRTVQHVTTHATISVKSPSHEH